ncbi:tripartite-type tricarboxylate transporter receptor subunit TctC [Comamonas sp. BIGb0124]|uniref:Bug family tripartite tricarboxylate transporter substrate binding protein n=1 Tax=Comamonas sp. BIGb0124 TaxID=2485130 RepID=UPI000F4A26DB|nr:tripartite tricarboxylate transporter substrate binding protein [Comamonas sp. BIGb0124]ROR20239.1 tripartite-type tricarboxylate transporter receptor subunit TctC [Comamonas sp. BIGb0124]
MQRRYLISSLVCAMTTLGLASPAVAQGTYPDHPVKVIVALPAGGSVDMIARVMSERLSSALKQPFVVDNRAGASGQIGVPAVARAPADGYTLMVSPASFLTTNKSIFKTLPYDPEADFVPITKLVNQPMVMVVRDRLKFPTLQAVIAAAKAKPGEITFASSGDGSPQHLAALMFETRTQVNMLHVPYKGGAPAINDLLAGHVNMMFSPMPEALPYLKSGQLHALGIMSDKRASILPGTPTMRENGIEDLTLSAWIGLLAPAKTPQPIVDQLNQAVHAILASDVRTKLVESGMEMAPTTPDELKKTISQEIKIHAELVKKAGLAPQ